MVTQWHVNGGIWELCHVFDSNYTGELLRWDGGGNITTHLYFERAGTCVHDFLLNPISDEEKMLLVLKHGTPIFSPAEILKYQNFDVKILDN